MALPYSGKVEEILSIMSDSPNLTVSISYQNFVRVNSSNFIPPQTFSFSLYGIHVPIVLHVLHEIFQFLMLCICLYVKGTTCHQCRQKTRDLKTTCHNENCSGVRGQVNSYVTMIKYVYVRTCLTPERNHVQLVCVILECFYHDSCEFYNCISSPLVLWHLFEEQIWRRCQGSFARQGT